MKPLRFAAILLTILLADSCIGAPPKAPLQSPWDANPVTATDAPYECPAAPELPHSFATNSYYTDEHHSVIDPALKKKYEDSVKGIEDFSRAVVKAADAYQTKGSRAAAQCVFSLLDSAAQQKVLTGRMDGGQASYVQGWNLGAWAVAYLKVRASGLGSAEQTKEIIAWLKKLAEDNRGYYDDKRQHHRPNDSDNNHLYWAGFAIAAAGIASDDRSLFDWSMEAYRHGVDQIQADGTLPLEMERGQMAFHYHLYALAPLIMLAEFGETNGVSLYAYHDYAIKKLVTRCVYALHDPSFFQQRTGVAQVNDAKVQAWEISWAQPYTRRFPAPEITKLLHEADWLNYTMLGGLPPP
jgi:poly(beta-D-mannuronate) lyase